MAETRFSSARRKSRSKDRVETALAKIEDDAAKAVEGETAADKRKARAAKARLKKERQFSCYIDPDLKQELQRICKQLPPAAIEGGQSGLVERALRAEVERLRREHNAGEPF